MKKTERRTKRIIGMLAILVCLVLTACGQEKQQEGNQKEAGGQLSVLSSDVFQMETSSEPSMLSWKGSRDLLSYPADKTADEMLTMTKDGSLNTSFVVIEDSDITHGEDAWDAFFERTRAGLDAQIQIAHYYTLNKESVSAELYEREKAEYPKLFLGSLLYYQDKYYYMVRAYNTTEIETGDYSEWKYLLGLYDVPRSTSARFSSCVHYVLTNDNTVTWDELEWGMFSSQFGDYIPHRTVISKYEWKE